MLGVNSQPNNATFSDITTNQTCHYFINRYLASNWSLDNTGPGNTFIQFSVTAGPETNLLISQVKYTRKRTETGPGAMILKYSTDGINFQDYSSSVDSVKTNELRRSLTRQIITEKEQPLLSAYTAGWLEMLWGSFIWMILKYWVQYLQDQLPFIANQVVIPIPAFGRHLHPDLRYRQSLIPKIPLLFRPGTQLR